MRLKRILVLCFLGLALLAPRMEGVETMKKNEKSQCGLPQSEEELRRILTPEQYRIMRQSGTEMPFANAYWNNKKPGIYVDTITGKPLFASVDKFDSGTGWPSFTKPISEGEIVEKADISHSMERTEVRSSSSDSHLGHLFEDGPKPTGQRYCINSAALRFIPVGDLKKEGYGSYLVLFGQENTAQTEIATFGAGCFWGVEEAFRQVKGVVGTAVGYMGGTWENPTYEDVCTDKTGHAEAVRVEFDPAVISYEQLLEVFWNIHDPTTPNRQGPDVGTQYRSVIFFHNPMQMEAALRSRQERQKSGEYKESIVTEIVPAEKFTKAEPYHQRYFEQRGIKPACHLPSNILKKQ